MTYPIRTIDIAQSIYRVRGGTFDLVAEGEFSTGQWAPTPRSTGPRHLRWKAELEMAALGNRAGVDQIQAWSVMAARLQGTSVAFRLHDPWFELPLGVGAGIWRNQTSVDEYTIDGAYLIDGAWHIVGGSTIAHVGAAAPRYADALHMTGLVASAQVFKAGDRFETGGNLYMVADDCLSDAAGECTVPFLWKLWKAALPGDIVNLYRPAGRFVLTSAEGASLSRSLNIGQASLSALEVPYV